MASPARLLIVDDDAAVLPLLKKRLEGLGPFEVVTAVGGREALRVIPQADPDLVLCDIDMPDLDGGSVAAALKADPAWMGLPLLFLTALISPGESAVLGDSIGGWPMLSKGAPLPQIVERIRGLMARYPRRRGPEPPPDAARVAALLEENARLAQASQQDPLTGALNRRGFLARAQEEEARWQRTARPYALVFGDVDQFKAVNDTLGHPFGDAVLVALAGILKAESRQQDLVARWGGEEFILLVPDATAASAAMLAEKIRAAVAATEVEHGQLRRAVTLTFGVAGRDQSASLEACIQQADQALYAGKARGRNQVVRWPVE